MSKLNRIFSFTNFIGRPNRTGGTNRVGRTSRAGRTGRAGRMVVGVILTLVLVVSAGYLTVSAIRLANGITRTVPAPSRFMRLQVVDGTGGDRPAFTRIADNLVSLSDSVLDITVIDRVQFVTRRIERSLIISRDANVSSARMLADKLGLNPDEVEHVPLEMNSAQATVTLVIGQDLISSGKLFARTKEKTEQD